MLAAPPGPPDRPRVLRTPRTRPDRKGGPAHDRRPDPSGPRGPRAQRPHPAPRQHRARTFTSGRCPESVRPWPRYGLPAGRGDVPRGGPRPVRVRVGSARAPTAPPGPTRVARDVRPGAQVGAVAGRCGRAHEVAQVVGRGDAQRGHRRMSGRDQSRPARSIRTRRPGRDAAAARPLRGRGRSRDGPAPRRRGNRRPPGPAPRARRARRGRPSGRRPARGGRGPDRRS